MQAVFSLIENIPSIHQIHPSEDSAKQGWLDVVIKYISDKREGKNLEKLSIPLAEISMDTFPVYPIQTYLVVDDKNVDIYLHHLVDKVEKGWIWNGKAKTVESQKIGYFKILSVLDDKNMICSDNIVKQSKQCFEESCGLLKIREEYQKNDDNDLVINLIYQIVDEINDTKSCLEKEIEEVKNLPETVDDEPLDFSDLPPLLDYSEKKFKFSSIFDYSKKNMYHYESILLPQIDIEEKNESSEETEPQETQEAEQSEAKQSEAEETQSQESFPEQMQQTPVPKYHSSQRGLRAIRRNMGRLGLGLPGRNSHQVTQLKKYRPYW